MDARCTGDVCSVLKSQTVEEAMKCTKARDVKEDVDGCKLHLLTVLGRSYGLHVADYLVGLTALPGDRMLF